MLVQIVIAFNQSAENSGHRRRLYFLHEICTIFGAIVFPHPAEISASCRVKLIFDAVSDLDLNWITCRPFPMGCGSSSCHKLYAEIAVSAHPLWSRSS